MKGYLIGAIGAITFALSSIIYTIGRYFSLNFSFFERLLTFTPDSFVFRIIYTLMAISPILMAISGIQFHVEYRAASPASPAGPALVLSIVASVFLIIFYPTLIYKPAGFPFTDAGLIFVSNILLIVAFVLFSSNMMFFCRIRNKSSFPLKLGAIQIIISIIYLFFSINTLITSNNFRWTAYGLGLGSFYIAKYIMESLFPIPEAFILFYQSFEAHLPLVTSFFALWLFAHLPLGVNSFLIGLFLYNEYNQSKIQLDYASKNKLELEEEIKNALTNIRKEYDGFTINALSSELGFRASIIRSNIEYMLNKKQIHGKFLYKNVFRFRKGYNFLQLKHEPDYKHILHDDYLEKKYFWYHRYPRYPKKRRN